MAVRTRVLDVPCGDGRIAGRLAARGCEVVGVDIAELFLERARRRYPGARFERITLEPDRRRSHTDRYIVREGRVRRIEFVLEQVPPDELERRLEAAGFRSVRLFGARGGQFEPEGPRVIALAQR